MNLKIIDLFCGVGGCSLGYYQGFTDAGYTVSITGVDIKPQPNYPFKFIQCDALRYLAVCDKPHLVVASPPCQGYSFTQALHNNEYPKLIKPLRELLRHRKIDYIIENVQGAKSDMIDPIMICGLMVGIPMIRHRLFESNLKLTQPHHPPHTIPSSPMGRKHQPGTLYPSPAGNFPQKELIRQVMGLDHAQTKYEIAQAIPPAYTKLIASLVASQLFSD